MVFSGNEENKSVSNDLNQIRLSGVLTDENGNKGLVQIQWVLQGLQFDNFFWPSEEMTFSRGGNQNSLIFIKHHLSKTTIYFELTKSNLTLLKKLNLISKNSTLVDKNHIHQVVNLIHNTGWFIEHTKTAAVVLLVVLFIGFIVSYRDKVFGQIGVWVPFQWEKSIADSVFNPQLTPNQLQLVKQLTEYFQPLQNTPLFSKSLPPIVLHISSDMTPNAYATIGGHIFINKGLFQLLDTPEKLSAVVAHEMMHVHYRHVSRSIFQALGVFAFFQLLIGDVSGLVAVLGDQGVPLLQLQYSRTLETQADEMAILLLAQNQIDPNNLGWALQDLSNESEKLIRQQPGSEILEKLSKIEWLSSHPEMKKRIDHIFEKSKNLDANRDLKKSNNDSNASNKNLKNQFNYNEFKTKLVQAF